MCGCLVKMYQSCKFLLVNVDFFIIGNCLCELHFFVSVVCKIILERCLLCVNQIANIQFICPKITANKPWGTGQVMQVQAYPKCYELWYTLIWQHLHWFLPWISLNNIGLKRLQPLNVKYKANTISNRQHWKCGPIGFIYVLSSLVINACLFCRI